MEDRSKDPLKIVWQLADIEKLCDSEAFQALTRNREKGREAEESC